MTVNESVHVGVLLVSACVSVFICVSMRGLPTRVRSHLTVISNSPETSGSQSCGGDSNGLSQICLFIFHYYFRFALLNMDMEHAHTHTRRHSLTVRITHLGRDAKPGYIFAR